MIEEIQFEGIKSKYFNSKKSTRVLVFLPGTSSGVFSGKYNTLMQRLVSENQSFIFPEIWSSLEELEEDSIEEIRFHLNKVFIYLKLKGFEVVVLVGKSFGATLSLLYEDKFIKSRILIAPVLSIGEEGKIETLLNVKLKEIKDLKDFIFSDEILSKINVPTLVLHGSEDAIISVETSKTLVKKLSNAKLLVIDGADHSFKDIEVEKKLIDEIVTFLTFSAIIVK